MDISFYHLTNTPLEQALPLLLEKIWKGGQRAVVHADTEAQVEFFADKFWTYKQLSFLPHGTRRDGHASAQPIWLTHTLENPNGAHIWIQATGFPEGGMMAIPVLGFVRCLDLFNGHSPVALEAARERWRTAIAAGWNCIYWAQNEQGGWVKGTEVKGADV